MRRKKGKRKEREKKKTLSERTCLSFKAMSRKKGEKKEH